MGIRVYVANFRINVMTSDWCLLSHIYVWRLVVMENYSDAIYDKSSNDIFQYQDMPYTRWYEVRVFFSHLPCHMVQLVGIYILQTWRPCFFIMAPMIDINTVGGFEPTSLVYLVVRWLSNDVKFQKLDDGRNSLHSRNLTCRYQKWRHFWRVPLPFPKPIIWGPPCSFSGV